jgi:hypothetical protein
LPKRDFEKLLLEAVDESLSTLGDSSRQAIYFHLEKSFNISKGDIPRKIEVFAEAIEKVFGFGADFLEILIMKRLHEKVGGTLNIHQATDFAFTDYMAVAKRSFMKKGRVRKMTKEVVRCREIKVRS